MASEVFTEWTEFPCCGAEMKVSLPWVPNSSHYMDSLHKMFNDQHELFCGRGEPVDGSGRDS